MGLLSSTLLQNKNLYHILHHNVVVCFQRMPYLALSHVHYKCPTGFKDLTGRPALPNVLIDSALSVRSSVTTFPRIGSLPLRRFFGFFLLF